MYKNVLEEMPAGLAGQFSRYNGSENVMPFIAEDDDCQAGVFAFDGSKPGKNIVAIASAIAIQTSSAIIKGCFIDTGFRVSTPYEIKCVAEITDKNF